MRKPFHTFAFALVLFLPAPPPYLPPQLSILDVKAQEGDSGTSTFTFTVILFSDWGQPTLTTFDIATQDGTATTADNDYVSRSVNGQVIWIGQPYTFDVQVNGDTSDEGDETFFARITNVSGALVARDLAQATIQNDDRVIPTLNEVGLALLALLLALGGTLLVRRRSASSP